MAPGWTAEPPQFPQEGGGQRGAQPSGVGGGEKGDPLLVFSRLSFPAAFQGSQPSAEALFQGPQMRPTMCSSRRGLCRGDYVSWGLPATPWCQCGLGLLAAHPHNTPGLPSLCPNPPTSFIHSLFQQVFT
ncbi:unnamed protein product [Rangifer tarandus platyrhynchus]|uniref:Uncharacterized protein n=2 Tax=Rangifer tarandus platyrhynchus TaxID=3082113 RepID=A0ABN8YYM8_RANTA|nr:unnamed protein product [Rangifer tarandus platyrhynchus]